MLFDGLFFGAILLAGTNLANLRKRLLVRTSIVLGLVCCAIPTIPLVIGEFLYVLWEFAAVLVVIALAVAKNRRWRFLPLSLVAAVVVFGVNSVLAWCEVEKLKADFPFESLEGRLPERPPSDEKVPEGFLWDANRREDRITDTPTTHSLRRLHKHTVGVFINRPNFGAARMLRFEYYLALSRELQKATPPMPQPGFRSSSAATWDEVGKEIPVEKAEPVELRLRAMHMESMDSEFLDPMRFGYFKDLRHVAGFSSHRFSRVPTGSSAKGLPPHEDWRVQRLDLVGLVLHPKPVAYVSENLPAMDELRKAPTRELNAFESTGLKALRESEELFVREMPDGSVRMLGALRALKQCAECHGCARGELLGAFSYELSKQ